MQITWLSKTVYTKNITQIPHIPHTKGNVQFNCLKYKVVNTLIMKLDIILNSLHGAHQRTDVTK